MPLKLLVVMNPSARDFEAQRRWPRMQSLLGGAADVTLLTTRPDNAETIADIAAALKKTPWDRVVAIGGDGTVHLVANALLRSGSPPLPELAVIPFGTANNVAKSLSLPLGELDALARIATGRRTTGLDLCTLKMQQPRGPEHRAWVNCVSVGMDADVVASRARFRGLGKYVSYAAALAERTFEQRSMDVQLAVNGASLSVRAFNVIVMNVPLYAGALRMPGSAMDDGLIDVYLFDRNEYASKVMEYVATQADVLQVGVADFIEELTQNQRALHGPGARLRLAWPRQVQVDGEAAGEAQDIEVGVGAQVRVAVG